VVAFVCYAAGLMLWVTDRLYCATVVSMHFHAWWHVLAGLGTYLFVIFTVALRAKRVNSKPAVDGVIPYVVYVAV